jgi:cytochrome c-type biogenesis protein CcmH/NrfG
MLGAYAQALLGAGRTEDAWEQFVAAWKLDNTDSEWIDGLGEIDPHRTIDLLKEELERNPGNDTAFSSLASLLGQVGRPEEALGMMRKLIERTPSPTGWLMTLSETMPAEAEVLTRQKLQKYPRDDELWGTLGKILFNQGRNDDALVAFRKANEIDPGDSEWHGYFQQMGVPIPRGGTSEVVVEYPFEEDPLPPR